MAFIVFEGLDGSGKSTLIKELAKTLDHLKTPYIITREPGGTSLAEELRNLLLRTDGESPVAKAELLIFEASRAQHVENKIKPALSESKWVLCDRFTASSVAFQSGGRQIKTDEVKWLNHFATSGLEPDLFVLLDISYDESQRRLHSREKKEHSCSDRMEQEDQSFHERIRSSYLRQAEQSPSQWLVLNAELSPSEMALKLKNVLVEKKWLKS